MKYKFIDKSKIHCFLYTFLSVFVLKGQKEHKELFLWSVLTNLKKKTKKDPFILLQSISLKLNLLCNLKHVKLGNVNYKIAISIHKKAKRKIACKILLSNVKYMYRGHNTHTKIFKEILTTAESSSKTLKTVENVYSSAEYSKTFLYNKI